MNTRTPIVAAGLVVLLVACAQPVPPDKAAYIGEWQAPDMYLLLQPDGRVTYLRVQGREKTRVHGPLRAFEAGGFTVGVWFLSTSFVVDKPPYEAGGTLRMVVDGVELIRIGDGSSPSPPNET